MGMNTCNDKLVTIGKTRGSVELYHPRLRYPGVGTTQPGLRLKSPKLWQLQAHSSEFLVYKAKDETLSLCVKYLCIQTTHCMN
jgi:hypothetical protein